MEYKCYDSNETLKLGTYQNKHYELTYDNTKISIIIKSANQEHKSTELLEDCIQVEINKNGKEHMLRIFPGIRAGKIIKYEIIENERSEEEWESIEKSIKKPSSPVMEATSYVNEIASYLKSMQINENIDSEMAKIENNLYESLVIFIKSHNEKSKSPHPLIMPEKMPKTR